MKSETKSILAAAIPTLISMVFVGIMLYFTVWESYKDTKFEKSIYKKALEGNKYALLLTKRSYNIRSYNKEIIEEVLKGNPNALEILGLKLEEMK